MADPIVYDVCIIGAGVVGCAIARELSRFNVDVVVVEKGNDVATGATKANSGIVHGGYTATFGTAKAALCRTGNRMYARLERELNFGYRETGSLVLAFDSHQQQTLRQLVENGEKNGVDDLVILSKHQIGRMEPAVSSKALEALYCPTTGVTSPYELAIALAENAAHNGTHFLLQAAVTAITPSSPFLVDLAPDGDGRPRSIHARYVVNAAGLYSDRVTAMVTEPEFAISPKQGQYVVFEKGYGDIVDRVIFQTPTEAGKGILVTPTYHRNLMIGPNANEVEDRDNVNTDSDVLSSVISRAGASVPNIDLSKAITTFAGVRASSTTGDFVITKTDIQGFIQAAGIDSPGLTSSPAIALRVRDLLADEGLELKAKSSFDPQRVGIIIPKSLSDEAVSGLLEIDSPERIICRCERVSQGEIVDAVGRGIPVLSIDAVKRRTRAGQGKCQGAFCRRRVADVLSGQLGRSAEEILAMHEEESRGKTRAKARLLHLIDRATSS